MVESEPNRVDAGDEADDGALPRPRRSFSITKEQRKRGETLENIALEDEWVVKEAGSLKNRLREEGLSQVSFFLGVLNLMIIAFVFGKWPQHVWLLYCVECAVLIPSWYYHVTTYRNGKWFIVELCWVTNTFFTLYMIATLVGAIPKSMKMFFFQMFFTHASYLSAFVVVGNQAVVFHSIEKTASLFIHLIPCLVAIILRWGHRLDCPMEKHWPGYFPTPEEMEQVYTYQNFLAGFSLYLLWLVFYLIWFFAYGIDLPARGIPTVFGNIYERSKLGPIMTKKFGYKSLRAHACIFMIFHVFLCALSLLGAATLGYWFVYFAVPWCCLHLVCALWSGAGYHLHVVVRHYELGEGDAQQKTD